MQVINASCRRRLEVVTEHVELLDSKQAGRPAYGMRPRVLTSLATAALMLALAHTLVTAELHDRAFIDRYCDGWAAFERYLLGGPRYLPTTAVLQSHFTRSPDHATHAGSSSRCNGASPSKTLSRASLAQPAAGYSRSRPAREARGASRPS